MVKLFYKDKPIIGLDISPTGIKVMAVDAKRWKVFGYGSLDLDPINMQATFESTDNTYLTENLTSLLRDKVIGTLPSNHAAIAIPAARTFSRTFSLPRDQEKNIASAVDIEVNQYIPIPSSALYVDYGIAERTKDTLTVLMSAVPKTLVDNCVDAAQVAGLRPVLVEPSSNAIARMLDLTEHSLEMTTLIIDIGTTSADIAILDRSAIRVTGSVPVGSNTFTVSISEKLGVSLENAHQMKVINGLNASPRQEKIKAALDPHLQRIVSEIHKVVRYYSERITEDRHIEQVLVVGSGSDIPGMGDYFTDALVMAARVASPWERLDFGKMPLPNKQFRPRYITVAGLSVIDKSEILR